MCSNVDSTNKKVAAVVVIYHPDEAAFAQNLAAYAGCVDKVLIWRNSNTPLSIPERFADKIIWCGEGENAYIATPLNYALSWCKEHGYEWLLTMDQDSLWHDCKGFIATALQQAEKGVAIYAPNVNRLFSGKEEITEVESVITSGSLCQVEIACHLGGFREDYRIYWVDGEYCYWARHNGYKIKMLTQLHLDQCFGKESRTRLGFTTANYSPTVYFFLFRNMLWMKREFRKNPSWRCVLYTAFINIRGILLGEKQKGYKIAMIVKACWQGTFKSIRKRHKP